MNAEQLIEYGVCNMPHPDDDVIVRDILDRWYRGVSHLTRSRMLVYGTTDICKSLDLDANWKSAIIDFVAAIEAWNRLEDVRVYSLGDLYIGYRHSIAHILTNAQNRWEERKSEFETADGHRGVLTIRSNQITKRTMATKKHPQGKAGSDRQLPDPVLGFRGSYSGQQLTCVDTDTLWRLWRTMFVFFDDYLSSHREFESALKALRSRVAQRNEADHPFNTHVFEHRQLFRDCEYCMLGSLEKSLQKLREG